MGVAIQVNNVKKTPKTLSSYRLHGTDFMMVELRNKHSPAALKCEY